MNTPSTARRLHLLKTIAAVMASLLLAKVWLSILWEYRWYFPANFEAAFLIGRQRLFTGTYPAAFYAHIISGPLAVLLGAVLLLSGSRGRFRKLHRWLGRLQLFVVLGAVTPSGLMMAPHALAGSVAGWGFASLALATGATAIAAVVQAVRRNLVSHRRWAGRCLVLLCSPLLLRVVSGGLLVAQRESELAYQLNAWLSWLLPLAVYEVWCRAGSQGELWRGKRQETLKQSHAATPLANAPLQTP